MNWRSLWIRVRGLVVWLFWAILWGGLVAAARAVGLAFLWLWAKGAKYPYQILALAGCFASVTLLWFHVLPFPLVLWYALVVCGVLFVILSLGGGRQRVSNYIARKWYLFV